MRRARFDKRGALAISASMLGVELEVVDAPATETRGSVSVVGIRGPLTQHPELLWDSYDAIKARVAEALAGPCQTVVLRIDSPGGDVAGCFDFSRDLRSMAAKAGKKLVAYGDGMLASAAYAIACACSQILCSSACAVGSIGVATMLVDTTVADRAMGLNFAVITSGGRKADGNPHVAISRPMLQAYQEAVDGLAGLFFDLVGAARPISARSVRGYEARMFYGANAQRAGLIDGVCTFDELISKLGISGPASNGAAMERPSGSPAVASTPAALSHRLAAVEKSLALERRRLVADVASLRASSPAAVRVAALEAELRHGRDG